MHKTIRFFSIQSLFLQLSLISFAQSVSIQLPYYAGRDYYFCLLKGTKQDTIAIGELDAGGRVSIALPEKYRGIGRLSIKEYGKIWNIIISGEEQVFMGELDAREAETTFEGSPENNFLLDALFRQDKIINEYIEVTNQLQNQSLSLVLASPEQRMQEIENKYKSFRKEISANPLYAARIMEILNCLSGAGGAFSVSQDRVLEEQREFVVQNLDFNDLYTSGFWQLIFEMWIQISVNDTSLLTDTRYILDKCNNDIRREVTQTIIRMFSKYAKDSLLAELGMQYLTMPLNGQPAPQIVTEDSLFSPKNSLIIFYETGCGNCLNELESLKLKYDLLKDNKIRVITIAADLDRNVFKKTALVFPWVDKLCDFKGFDGANFRNYGIVGTPTFILTDREGIVRGRYAQLKELLKE